MHCPLGNHLLRGTGVFITNPRHISFINKFFPDFLPSEKVCAKCKQDIGNAYEHKIKRALELRGRNATLISSYSTEESSVVENHNNERNANARQHSQEDLVVPSSISTDDDDGQPTTSAQAAAKRKRKEERQRRVQQQNLLAINVQRGARLPHIQPVARRQQFVHANADIMDIYIRGITGG